MFTGADRYLLKLVNAKLDCVLNKEEVLMATVQELNDAVAELETAVDAAVAAIGSTGINPADLDPAVAAIKTQIGKLNDAVHAAGM